MPRLPLARVHRPQRFADVLGQAAPVRALATAAARGEIAAAYIFSGTRGIGKTTIARIFAKALNCERGPAADCCDQCVPCREIAEGRALDVLELDAATHTGIDDIRELREAARYAPARDRRRVFIIDEAHQLSQSAWNGLLKILEEPPPWCVFLFCTTEPHKIPATIESRALHFSFRSLTPAQIREHLARIADKEGVTIEPEALELLVRAADGSVRDGLSALDQVRALADGPVTRDVVREALGLAPGEAVTRFVEALGAGDAPAALTVVAGLDEEGQDLRAFTAEVLDLVRRLALVKAAGPRLAPEGAALVPLTQSFVPEQLVWLGKVLDETEARLRQGGASRAILDLATLRMGSMAGLTSLADLADQVAPADPAVPGREPGGRGAPRAARGPGAAGSGGDRSSPPPAAPARQARAIEAAAQLGGLPAGVSVQAVGALLPRLVEVVQGIRPSLAAYLQGAESAEVLPSGVLRLSLPPGKEVHETRLSQPAARATLLAAVQRATGQTPTTLELVPAATTNQVAEGLRPTRREVLEHARKDPLVQALFDQFGAVMVDGHPLGPKDPQEP